MEIDVRQCDAAKEPAASLLRAAEEVLTGFYGKPDSQLASALFLPPDGCYLIAWQDGAPVGGGGYTRHDAATAEVRRMYVVPSARSRGVARQLLHAIEDAAKTAGYKRLILDTGPKQPHAEALYRSAGYTDIGNYRPGRSRASFWGEKVF